MITIEIHEETATREDMADALERIAELLREGYIMGTDPGWETSGEEEEESEEVQKIRDEAEATLDEQVEKYEERTARADQNPTDQRIALNDIAESICRDRIAEAELRDRITASEAEALRDEVHGMAADRHP